MYPASMVSTDGFRGRAGGTTARGSPQEGGPHNRDGSATLRVRVLIAVLTFLPISL